MKKNKGSTLFGVGIGLTLAFLITQARDIIILIAGIVLIVIGLIVYRKETKK